MAKNTKIFTLFTDAPFGITRNLYSSPPDTWTRVRLLLETAGPVSVGTNENLGNVLGGQGIILPTGEWVTWDLSSADRLYWVAESINRVKVSIEAIAYGDEYAKTLGDIRDAEQGVRKAVVAATPPAMREIEVNVPRVVPRPPAPRMPAMPPRRR